MFGSLKVFISSIVVLAVVVSPSVAAPAKPVELLPSAPLLHKHGRWDENNGTWWPGSGVKLVASGLTSLTLHLGEYTNYPHVSVSVSVDYSDFATVNVSAGANSIPIPPPPAKASNRVVRLNVEASTGTRLHLKKIELNPGAVVKPYKPSSLRFQFIGDSLTAGYLNPHGVNDAWSFQAAQKFKAEHNIMAQSGACLTDIECWSNIHGISYQYFKTEDTGYRWTSDHNYTTPWNFKRDLVPSHVFVVIGANDNSYNVPANDFANTLSTFITNLRTVYPKQPLFVFTPWGWSNGESPFYTYYDGVYASVVDQKVAAGDKRIYLVNTTGWLQQDGVYPNDGHPNPVGHQQILVKLTEWLGKWGLKPKTKWES